MEYKSIGIENGTQNKTQEWREGNGGKSKIFRLLLERRRTLNPKWHNPLNTDGWPEKENGSVEYEKPVVKIMEKFLVIFGRPMGKPVQPLFFLAFIVMASNFVQTMIRQFTAWKDISNRILAIENLNVTYFTIIILVELAISPKNQYAMIGLMKEPIFKNSHPYSKVQKNILQQQTKTEIDIYRRIISVSSIYPIINGIIPFLVGLYNLNFTDFSIETNEDVVAPYDCWFPYLLDTNFKYVTAVIPQLLCRVYCLVVGLHWTVLALSVMRFVSTELKVLMYFVEEMDERLGVNPSETVLRRYLAIIIQHHARIIRCVSNINKFSKIMMLAFNQMLILEVCLACYSLIEVDSLAIRLRSAGVLFVTIVVNASFSSFGQEIIDESNNFRSSLEQSSWVGKPKTYKKMLLIMLRMAHKDLHIKPAGLYILNTEHTKYVLNAGYSYLNLMKNVRSIE